jgi:hypothetical protein
MESKNLQEINLLREEIKRLKEINDIQMENIHQQQKIIDGLMRQIGWLEGDIETLKEK